MLTQEEENKIMYYNCKGDYKNLYRYLFKLLNTREYNYIDTWRITYDLANCSYRINNIDNAKKYINMSIEFMNQVTELGYDQKKAYTTWMYLYIYQDELTKEESLKEYDRIKKMLYFDKEDEIIKAIDFDIALIKENKEEMCNIIKYMIKYNYIDSLKDILENLNNKRIFNDIVCFIQENLKKLIS